MKSNMHHEQTFQNVAFEHGALSHLEDAVGIADIGEQGVVLQTEKEFANQHVAGLGLCAFGVGGLKAV